MSQNTSESTSSPSLATSDHVSNAEKNTQAVEDAPKRDLMFWMSFVAICISVFISALEATAVSTALPRIINDLHGTQFLWIGSSYALAAAAFLPLSGNLAQVFGRRIVMLALLVIFAVGSALCGAATSLNFLIVGRTIQGVGGGGIASLTQIVLSDLVPLRERGAFNGLVAIAYGVACSIGPVVGGSLAEDGQWRWLFYLNIPICGIAGILVVTFLRLRTPRLTFRERMEMMDWTGNFLVIASTTAVVIALTWGGIQFPWNSTTVLVPLILGMVGLAGFLAYEAKFPKYPIAPLSLMSTLTGLSGYAQTFLMPIVHFSIVYYLPVYYQACKGASPIASGIDLFPFAYTLVPAGITSGLTVKKFGAYRPQLWLAWCIAIIGMGLMSTVEADTSRARSIGFQLILGTGLGILYSTTFFPVLAPLPASANASALAYFMFLRWFAQVWGVTIGGTILQNELHKRLPAEFAAQFPEGTAIAYAIIPLINTLDPALRDAVRIAFAGSVRVIWQVLIGVAGLGLLTSLLMKALPLHTELDKDWGLENRDKELVEAEMQGKKA